nr:S24 family peptidase [Collinsella urealyticum]
MPIVAKLGLDPVWIVKNQLRERDEDESKNFTYVPLYGSIAAGSPIEMIEVDDHHPIPNAVFNAYPRAFLLEVNGESMNRVIPNGSYVLVDPCVDVDRDMEPYAVCVNGYDATIKRVRKLENGFELVPDSIDPTFRPKIYDYGVEGTDEITIIGRVVWYCIPFDWSF